MEAGIDLERRQLPVDTPAGSGHDQYPNARMVQLRDVADQHRKQGVIEKGILDFQDEQLSAETGNVGEHFPDRACNFQLVLAKIILCHLHGK